VRDGIRHGTKINRDSFLPRLLLRPRHRTRLESFLLVAVILRLLLRRRLSEGTAPLMTTISGIVRICETTLPKELTGFLTPFMVRKTLASSQAFFATMIRDHFVNGRESTKRETPQPRMRCNFPFGRICCGGAIVLGVKSQNRGPVRPAGAPPNFE